VHLVSVLEEMPVQETQDAVAELRRIGLPVGAVVVNMVREPLLPEAALAAAVKGRLPVAKVVAGLALAGLAGHGVGASTSSASSSASSSARTAAGRTTKLRPLAEALIAEGLDHAERVRLEQDQRAALTSIGRPLVELPALAEGIDLGALYALAERLTEQGMS
jgi:anion-transporting  ArsA/GET3 family ATPase